MAEHYAQIYTGENSPTWNGENIIIKEIGYTKLNFVENAIITYVRFVEKLLTKMVKIWMFII